MQGYLSVQQFKPDGPEHKAPFSFGSEASDEYIEILLSITMNKLPYLTGGITLCATSDVVERIEQVKSPYNKRILTFKMRTIDAIKE